MRSFIGLGLVLASGSAAAFTGNEIKATLVVPGVTAPLRSAAIELKNDSFVDGSGAYLQQGFVTGEMAGVWVKVPATVSAFKVDSFRVLLGGGDAVQTAIFFGMAIADNAQTSVPGVIQNAAEVQVGNFFNDIPAQGDGANLGCAKGGQYVGAYVEFMQDGVPSVYRDAGPMNVLGNVLNANPGGWNYSAAYGLRGNWIMRVVGHEALPGECI